MPVFQEPKITTPFLFRNPHFQTIYASIGRKVQEIPCKRERIITDDNDFLDLDLYDNYKSLDSSVVIISHGLEGSSKRVYVKGLVRSLLQNGFSVVAWNYRGCSGEPNNNLRWYHSGFTEDLNQVINYTRTKNPKSDIILIGISVGGNITLKYLGENTKSNVKCAVAISVPIDLEESAEILAKNKNFIYMKYFIRSFKKKIRDKHIKYPKELPLPDWSTIKNFYDYDSLYTAPLFGYKDAKSYWRENSSKNFLSSIKTPTLLISALDDPFLGEKCLPFKEAASSEFLNFLPLRYGGHVGFMSEFNANESIAEAHTMKWLKEMCA